MLRGKKKHDEEAIASTNTLQVQQNWQDRDFLVSVQLGVTQLSAFLNDFGTRARIPLFVLRPYFSAGSPFTHPSSAARRRLKP